MPAIRPSPTARPRTSRKRQRAKAADGGSLLDHGLLPVEELATLGEREGWRPRPIYQAHRWFVRRFGSAFRSLLVAAQLDRTADFWKAYYEGVDYTGKVVLDPFVVGGTSVVEALRLGADVIGVDVDAVACAITRFESRAGRTPDLGPTLERLSLDVGRRMARYCRTRTPDGKVRQVLHYFYVQVVRCRRCKRKVEAHPHHQLAYEAEGDRQWAFCPTCHEIQELSRKAKVLQCQGCRIRAPIADGPAAGGRLVCPHCGEEEQLIDAGRRIGCPPEWRLFALETWEPSENNRPVQMAQRRFYRATEDDRTLLAAAGRALGRRKNPEGGAFHIPERLIPAKDWADNRLIDYGYTQYKQLFNPRQLLHLSLLAEAIDQMKAREAMALAFSDHLTTNCMMTNYAFGWRRLAPCSRSGRSGTLPVLWRSIPGPTDRVEGRFRIPSGRFSVQPNMPGILPRHFATAASLPLHREASGQRARHPPGSSMRIRGRSRVWPTSPSTSSSRTRPTSTTLHTRSCQISFCLGCSSWAWPQVRGWEMSDCE